MKTFESVADLAREVKANPELRSEIASNPGQTLERVAGTPLETDPWIYRVGVIALGFTLVFSLIAGVWIATRPPVVLNDTEVLRTAPDMLLALGSASAGALAGLLAPSKKRS